LSPRAALLFRQSPATVYKVLWGRAFRNPTAFEAYWTDQGQSQVPNPGLQPEHADTWEASWERLVKQRINLVATAYRYDLRGLIEALPADNTGLLYQYRNVAESQAYGAEFEIHGRFSERVEGGTSFAMQHTEDPGLGMAVPNSPGRVAKLRLAVPLWRRRVFLASDWQYLSARSTLAGNRLPGVAVGGMHVSTAGLNPNFDLQLGVGNVLNHRYEDPVGGLVIDQILADGRSVYLKLIWHTRD